MPAYACPDLVSAALHAGASPVLVDVDENSPFLSCEQVLKNISTGTVAILAVNFMGLHEDTTQLGKICANNGLFLIYDCAQWFPLEEEYAWPGDFNTVSFGRGKPVGLLHGGAVIPGNPELGKMIPDAQSINRNIVYNFAQYLKIRIYNFLVQPLVYRFASQMPGLNIGLTVYKPLHNITAMEPYYSESIKTNIDQLRAHQNARVYLHQRLRGVTHPLLVNLVTREMGADPGYLLRYPILIINKKARDLFFEQTRDYGVSTLYRRPLNEISGLENILDQAAVYPNASNFADHLVTLPCHEDIGKAVVDTIVDRLLATLNR